MATSVSSLLPTRYLRLSNTVQTSMSIAPIFRGSGVGTFAGTYPDGLTRIEGVPTEAEVFVRVFAPGKPFDGAVLARTLSESSGEWEVPDMPKTGLFDVVARKEGERSVTAPQVVAYSGDFSFSPFGTLQSCVPAPQVRQSADVGYHWTNSALYAANTTSSSWAGYTLRQVIPASELLTCAKLRITFGASYDNVVCAVGAAYIQKQAPSGDLYDFSTTPVQITVGGSNSFAIAGTAVSDPISLAVTSGDILVLSVYFTSGYPQIYTTLAGVGSYYRNANDPSTVNTSGYTNSAGRVVCLQRIECLVAD